MKMQSSFFQIPRLKITLNNKSHLFIYFFKNPFKINQNTSFQKSIQNNNKGKPKNFSFLPKFFSKNIFLKKKNIVFKSN